MDVNLLLWSQMSYDDSSPSLGMNHFNKPRCPQLLIGRGSILSHYFSVHKGCWLQNGIPGTKNPMEKGGSRGILFYGKINVSLLTKTPLPRIPPKYQTSSERWLLSSITFPPGKNSRIFARRPNTARGMRVPPRHLAQPPVHMLGWHSKAQRSKAPHHLLHWSPRRSWQHVSVAVLGSVRNLGPSVRAL